MQIENGVPFLKMHGLGNDFVVLDARSRALGLTPEIVAAIGDRHTGVGFDQLAVIEPARREGADCYLSLFNADGSSTAACGNATRCVASLIMAEKNGDSAVIETPSGILPAKKEASGLYQVDMGPARLDWREIPLSGPMDSLRLPIFIEGMEQPVGVGMGNPHAVFFVPDIAVAPVETLGPQVETMPLFPERVNVEFAQILSPRSIRMRVWERGTGVTRACGTGACATLVAAVRLGLAERRAEVILDGGKLIIEWREDGHVLMSGAVETSFSGRLPPALLK